VERELGDCGFALLGAVVPGRGFLNFQFQRLLVIYWELAVEMGGLFPRGGYIPIIGMLATFIQLSIGLGCLQFMRLK